MPKKQFKKKYKHEGERYMNATYSEIHAFSGGLFSGTKWRLSPVSMKVCKANSKAVPHDEIPPIDNKT